MKDHNQFTWLVAKGAYSCDDYGLDCYYCSGHCDNYQEENMTHDSDCAMLRARRILGDEWVKHEEELKAKKAEELAIIEAEAEKRERKRRIIANRVNCDICNKHVSKDGLEAHKRMNKDCLEQAKKFRSVLVEVTDNWDDRNQ